MYVLLSIVLWFPLQRSQLNNFLWVLTVQDICKLVNVGSVNVGVKTVSDMTLSLADVNFPIVIKVGPTID